MGAAEWRPVREGGWLTCVFLFFFYWKLKLFCQSGEPCTLDAFSGLSWKLEGPLASPEQHLFSWRTKYKAWGLVAALVASGEAGSVP